ncbi:Hypothetical protein CINCED_3A022381 [Cinara cedri]|uniref:Uncharacterized protein n=1 Tax=Cinara cedri TaxID=506608 RepID=A0A5E4MTL0_9HEMI|nr:Hypothetical protein CINCED_3A022381 [Cinara cedri]
MGVGSKATAVARINKYTVFIEVTSRVQFLLNNANKSTSDEYKNIEVRKLRPPGNLAAGWEGGHSPPRILPPPPSLSGLGGGGRSACIYFAAHRRVRAGVPATVAVTCLLADTRDARMTPLPVSVGSGTRKTGRRAERRRLVRGPAGRAVGVGHGRRADVGHGRRAAEDGAGRRVGLRPDHSEGANSHNTDFDVLSVTRVRPCRGPLAIFTVLTYPPTRERPNSRCYGRRGFGRVATCMNGRVVVPRFEPRRKTVRRPAGVREEQGDERYRRFSARGTDARSAAERRAPAAPERPGSPE